MSGLLIQAAVGSSGGTGGLRTNRSGCRGVGGVEDAGAAAWSCFAWPWWTAAGVIRPIPEWRWSWLYQSKNVAAERAGVLDVVEAVGELGPVLQRLEVRLASRGCRSRCRARVCLGDAEVGEQERDRLAAHRRAAVGVHRQLLARDLLLLGGLLDQRLGELRVSRCCTVQPTA